ncbi:DUF2240 family protein [Candidatus Woesearchaeota archaeon]|nr:DUF2240 family protein [Candidatus Woesearchaeota archaeon]
MIKLPYESIVEKIKAGAGLSEKEIDAKVNEKMKQLSGLISREGAAHIISNELGIKLLEQTSGKLQIKNIIEGMRDVETVGRVQQKYELREFNTNGRQGKVASLVLADETGRIRVVMWGDQADNLNNLKENDILKVQGGYVRNNTGRLELHINDRSKVIINPPGESVNAVQAVQQARAERKEIKDISEKDAFAEIMGTIVQAYDVRFFESKREGEKPYSYVLNAVIDDGTDNIRVAFFREQAEKLTKLNYDQMMQFQDNIDAFEEIKTALLGMMVKVAGRVKKNDMFDRLEMVANFIEEANPDEEIRRLNEQAKKV